MRQCLQSAGEQGETLLCPIEGLNRARLITRQHQRVLGRVEVQTHDIDELFDEPGIVRDLERFHAMRLQPVVAPDALHRGLADSRRLGHHSHRPVRGVGRSLPSGLGDHVRLFRDPDRRCPTTARGILFDPRQPIRSKPVPPGSDRRVHPRSAAISSFRRPTAAARTILALKHQSRRRTPPARPFRQRRSFFRRHCDDLRNPHGMILRGWSIRRQNPQIRSRILETLH